MLLVPDMGDELVVTNLGTTGSGLVGTAVPDGASNTYGTVTELISAANNVQDSWAIGVLALGQTSPSAVADEMAVDILIGGATDDVLISSLIIGGTFYGGGRAFFFPVHVPGGVRIAARLAAVTAQSPEVGIAVFLYGGPAPAGTRSGRKVTTYGTKINDARGLAVNVAASGGAASVTEMTASTSEDHFYFLPGFQVSTDSTIANATAVNVGIGVGAATEERIGTWIFTKNASEIQAGPFPSRGAFRHVPSGSRLTLLCSNGAANDAAHDGHIYCVS